MTETNHFQTIPDKLQYNPVITESNKNSVSEEKFFQKFAKSFDINKPKEFDFSNENTIHKTTDDKHRKKIFYGIFGFTFLIVMVFFVIALSYLYQSNDKNNFQKIVPKTHDDIAEILKIESKSNAKTLFDKAKQFEQDGSTLQALKNRLQGINNYIQFKEYPAALSEAEKADSLLKTQFKNDNSDIISKLRIYHYNFFSEIYYRLNNPKQAVNYSDKALRQSLIYYGTKSLKTAKQYELMAFNLDNIGDFEQSLKLRHNAINIRLRYADTKVDQGKLITDMNNLGEEYRSLEYLQESKAILLQAIDKVEKKHGIDAPELIILLNNLGLTYQANNEKTIALSYLQQAHRLAQRHYGDNHDLTRVIAKNITSLRGFRL